METLQQQKTPQKTSYGSRSRVSDATISHPSRTIVHAKLEMTEPGDHDEQEADAAANDIVSGGKIRRKISNGGGSGISVSPQVESQIAQLQGGGHAMPAGLRNMMENGFGRDFSQVRLHTDSQAADMSSSISARAFTHGNDIYFNRGQFSPNTSEGQRLVAHELTHVAQGTGKVGREKEDINKLQEQLNKNYRKECGNNQSNSRILPFELDSARASIVYNAASEAIVLIENAIFFINEAADSLDVFESYNSRYYKPHVNNNHPDLVRNILNKENIKNTVINNLINIQSKISNYSFSKYENHITIINDRNEETYGRNYNGKILLSNMFFNPDFLSEKDQAFALIHEFAHFVLGNGNNELYIYDFSDTTAVNDIVLFPDFYVLLCYLSD